MNPDQDAYQSSIKMLQHWIGGMQSTQNYSGIDTWPLHIPIHNLSSLEKNTKSGHKNLLKCFTLINRRNVVFLRDNTRLHSAKHTKEIILDWGWSVQPHPPYSPDLTTTDFNLFGFLQNVLNDKRIFSRRSGEIMENFLSSKLAEFYLRGINKAPEDWEDASENNGESTYWL